MLHQVHILVYTNCQLLDFAGPLAVFEAANGAADRPFYETKVVSIAGGTIQTSCGLMVSTIAMLDAGIADTLLVSGGIGAQVAATDADVCAAIKKHVLLNRRCVSVCTGSLILAGAGVLRGKKATTHWRFASAANETYGDVRWDAGVIWARDGDMWTSAGVCSGMDISLALVEEDLGENCAKTVAQEIVLPMRRPGQLSQHSTLLHLVQPKGRFAGLLEWVMSNLPKPISVEDLAHQAAMSPRNFARAFKRETGQTPAAAIRALRVEAALALIKRGDLSMTQIAKAVGFATAERMRREFEKSQGCAPSKIWRKH